MMDKLYPKLSPGLLVVMTLVFLTQCSRDLTYEEALKKNREKIEDPKKREDADFLVETRSLTILESKITEMAIGSGYASVLVSMAKQSFEDHKIMNEDLDKLARKEDIKLPTTMSESHKSLHDELARTSRQNFDKNFIQLIKKINEENSHTFVNKATEASDPDIRAFAARKLDVLRLHSQKIEEVEKELL